MMNIEYENNIPKGYVQKRRKAGFAFICFMYTVAAANVLISLEVITLPIVVAN